MNRFAWMSARTPIAEAAASASTIVADRDDGVSACGQPRSR